jgi:hypothetical protein
MDDGYQYFKKITKNPHDVMLDFDGWMKNDVSMTL